MQGRCGTAQGWCGDGGVGCGAAVGKTACCAVGAGPQMRCRCRVREQQGHAGHRMHGDAVAAYLAGVDGCVWQGGGPIGFKLPTSCFRVPFMAWGVPLPPQPLNPPHLPTHTHTRAGAFTDSMQPRCYPQGRCRAIGVSNFEERHVEELLRVAEVKPMVGEGRERRAAPRTSIRMQLL